MSKTARTPAERIAKLRRIIDGLMRLAEYRCKNCGKVGQFPNGIQVTAKHRIESQCECGQWASVYRSPLKSESVDS